MKKPTAFITGIAGFAGSYLAEELLAAGFQVSGARYKTESIRNLKAISKQIELVSLDILNPDKCRQVISKLKPDYVFHLAAMASVGESFDRMTTTFRINCEGTINVLEAARASKKLKSFMFVSSSDIYGAFSPVNKTLTETQPVNPISPYGISKSAAEQVCRHYFRRYNFPVIMIRAFNHSGPRQTDTFAIPSFARQVATIEAGQQKPVMKVGDLSARRDLSDVRDIVRGYRLAATLGKPGEVYQLCSGKAVPIQKVVDLLIAGSTSKIRLQVDKKRLRPAEIPVLRGSRRKATQQLGYEVRYSLKDTVIDTLNFWRNELGLVPGRK
ncbi:MAG: GDP-mannose 4,6-dehydratase [candidate division Zixibacteria bacterium]|nr:GDP-mannose 4,6-dehydratase [candidate division Zixibacteria bacterium]